MKQWMVFGPIEGDTVEQSPNSNKGDQNGESEG